MKGPACIHQIDTKSASNMLNYQKQNGRNSEGIDRTIPGQALGHAQDVEAL